MGAIGYILLFVGALAGGFVSGLAGFGTALMALGIWLYILPPSVAVPLVLICSVVAQSATLPSMWKSFDLTLVWPMAFGFGGRIADGIIGFIGGILGGLAGLSGPPPILWASVRGWGKDERRGVFQTFNWTVLFAALCLQAASGLVAREVIWLAALAFPATILGSWIGARLYHALSDRNFRDVVLGMLVVSGLTLIWNSLR